jgi:hypothetical protein
MASPGLAFAWNKNFYNQGNLFTVNRFARILRVILPVFRGKRLTAVRGAAGVLKGFASAVDQRLRKLGCGTGEQSILVTQTMLHN